MRRSSLFYATIAAALCAAGQAVAEPRAPVAPPPYEAVGIQLERKRKKKLRLGRLRIAR